MYLPANLKESKFEAGVCTLEDLSVPSVTVCDLWVRLPENRIKGMALNFSDTYCSIGCMPKKRGESIYMCVNVCVKNITNSYHCADIWIVSGIPLEKYGVLEFTAVILRL